MSLLNRITSFLTGSTRAYDGAGGGRRWKGQGETPVTISAQIAARGPLARRARYLVSNNALGASGVEAWVSALAGSGIKPQSNHADLSIRTTLNLAFETWTSEADADGIGDFYALQSLMIRRLTIDGEAFALLLNTDDGLRVRLIDGEQVDPSLHRELPGGGRIVAGVEFDAQGIRVAYHIFPERPGLPFANMPLTARRVPAGDVVHLFKPETPGQVRGVSWFAPVMLRLADMDQWRDSQLARQKVAAALAAFVTTEAGGTSPFEGDGTSSTPPDGTLVGGLEPGTIKFLPWGTDIKFSSPANVGDEVLGFAKTLEREIAVGLGLPSSILSGDLSDVNYSSIRAGLVDFNKRVTALQYSMFVFQALRPIWNRWVSTEVVSGRVSTTINEALPVKWIVPKQAWIDPKKDVEAELAEIAGGLKSRRSSLASRGEDIEQIDNEIAADHAREKRLGLDFSAKPANDNNPPIAAVAA